MRSLARPVLLMVIAAALVAVVGAWLIHVWVDAHRPAQLYTHPNAYGDTK